VELSLHTPPCEIEESHERRRPPSDFAGRTQQRSYAVTQVLPTRFGSVHGERARDADERGAGSLAPHNVQKQHDSNDPHRNRYPTSSGKDDAPAASARFSSAKSTCGSEHSNA